MSPRSAAPPEPPPAADAHPFDPALVRELAGLLAETDLTEIEVEKGDLRIRVARHHPPVAVAAQPMAASPTFVVPAAPQAVGAAPSFTVVPPSQPAAKHPDAIPSPMVGTVYRRPAPGSPTFVEVGSEVRLGDKLLLIEAMKTFNDIVAPRAGTVRAIYVDDGAPVEYGEPLIVIA